MFDWEVQAMNRQSIALRYPVAFNPAIHLPDTLSVTDTENTRMHDCSRAVSLKPRLFGRN
jgi:hypothetical protein